MEKTIKQIMKENGISPYAIVKAMGFSPVNSQTVWTRRINGKAPVNKVQLAKLISAVNRLSSRTNDITTTPVMWMLK